MSDPRETPTVDVPTGLRVGGPGGRYEVVRLVASGAWGSVYAGRRLDIDSTSSLRAGQSDSLGDGTAHEVADLFALKFLAPNAATPRMRRVLSESVRREVESRDVLHHPRLVQFIEVLTVDDPGATDLDGAVVLVMELATGSLAELLDEHKAGLLQEDAAVRLAEITEALAYMHDAGWVHGDLKPSNVLLRRDGTCCLTDFGLSGLLEGTHAYIPPLATPDYAPPERREAMSSSDGQQIRASGDI